jgi:hypothetical protein
MAGNLGDGTAYSAVAPAVIAHRSMFGYSPPEHLALQCSTVH